MSSDAQGLVDGIVERLRPLETAFAKAWWETSTHASPEADGRRAEIDLRRRAILADPEAFDALRAARAVSDLDPLVRREVDVLHDTFAPHQVPAALREQLVTLETRVESTFNSFRGEIAGRRYADNELVGILRTSDDVDERRAAWAASKQVGGEVADQVRTLAHVRNGGARSLGYRDHFELALATGELDEARLFATLDEVNQATAAPFRAWKAELDATRADRFDTTTEALRPWHYDDPFFQEPPARGELTLDEFFADADIEALALRTYDGLGIDIRPVLAASDLYRREGKSQHAFSIDIDRAGDVRVLCNVEPNERWMETMLHELGHAAYDREIDRALPWLLRGAAHALTTEGIAMLLERLPRDPEWLAAVAGMKPTEAEELRARLSSARRAGLLTFARWVLVMTHFERGLYADPDGDLETRWWDLAERFQGVLRPEPGLADSAWASKIHLTVAPVYYQNYLYGTLVASQLDHTLASRFGGIVDRTAAGRFLVEEFFAPGMSLRWDRLIEHVTGEPLSVVHLARLLDAPL
jgi:peptidyl-dipeptidase A